MRLSLLKQIPDRQCFNFVRGKQRHEFVLYFKTLHFVPENVRGPSASDVPLVRN